MGMGSDSVREKGKKGWGNQIFVRARGKRGVLRKVGEKKNKLLGELNDKRLKCS